MDNEESTINIQKKIDIQSRNLKNINTEQFKKDLKNKLENMQRNVNTEIYGNYIKTITSTIEEHAPTLRRKHIKKKHESWFDEEALKLKVQRRRVEKIWQKAISASWQMLQVTLIPNKKEDLER